MNCEATRLVSACSRVTTLILQGEEEERGGHSSYLEALVAGCRISTSNCIKLVVLLLYTHVELGTVIAINAYIYGRVLRQSWVLFIYIYLCLKTLWVLSIYILTCPKTFRYSRMKYQGSYELSYTFTVLIYSSQQPSYIILARTSTRGTTSTTTSTS
jgi:hypothetical protein